MPQHHRLDGYGQPLPELADVRREVMRERPFNVEQRRVLLQCLEDLFERLLRRGTHAEVTIRFVVANGLIQSEIGIGVTRQYRTKLED